MQQKKSRRGVEKEGRKEKKLKKQGSGQRENWNRPKEGAQDAWGQDAWGTERPRAELDPSGQQDDELGQEQALLGRGRPGGGEAVINSWTNERCQLCLWNVLCVVVLLCFISSGRRELLSLWTDCKRATTPLKTNIKCWNGECEGTIFKPVWVTWWAADVIWPDQTSEATSPFSHTGRWWPIETHTIQPVPLASLSLSLATMASKRQKKIRLLKLYVHE